MKKLFSFVAFVASMLVFTACGGGNTPKAVAEEATQAMKDRDAKKLVELIYNDKEGEASQNEKDMLVAMFQEKMDKQYEKDGGIKSYEAVSEEIAEDGKTATVTMKIEYENGKTDEDVMKLKQNDKGEWKIDMSK